MARKRYLDEDILRFLHEIELGPAFGSEDASYFNRAVSALSLSDKTVWPILGY